MLDAVLGDLNKVIINVGLLPAAGWKPSPAGGSGWVQGNLSLYQDAHGTWYVRSGMATKLLSATVETMAELAAYLWIIQQHKLRLESGEQNGGQ